MIGSLGVLRDLALLLDKQVSAVARSTFYHLYQVCHLCPFLIKKDLCINIPALVTSRIDYCNMFCVGLPLELAWKFQLVKNTTAWLTDRNQISAHLFSRIYTGSQYFDMPNIQSPKWCGT